MTKSKASDVLGRMKAAATREKPLSTLASDQAFIDPQPDAPATPDESSPLPSLPKARKVRFTLDLDPVQHKNLKRFALEADTDASEVLRALLALLHSDTATKNAVLTAISKDDYAE